MDNQNKTRSLKFKDKTGPRYGWFRDTNYVPFTFSYLADSEWQIIEDWYEDTEKNKVIGESSPGFMGMLQALIMGNNLSRVVQLGHYAGYSAMLMGFMFRHMGKKTGLFSIDIDQFISDFAQSWIEKAQLTEIVKIHTGNSYDEAMPKLAEEYLGGKPELVVIDASHQYQQTKEELSLWYKELEFGGYIVLHDASAFAQSYDTTNQGGVKKAIEDWCEENKVKYMNIYPRLFDQEKRDPAERALYMDPCGISIIQK